MCHCSGLARGGRSNCELLPGRPRLPPGTSSTHANKSQAAGGRSAEAISWLPTSKTHGTPALARRLIRRQIPLKGRVRALIFVGVAGKNVQDVNLSLQGNVDDLAHPPQKSTTRLFKPS